MTDLASIVRDMYAAFNRGDAQFILDALAPEVHWISEGDPEMIPWAGARSGREGALEYLQRIVSHVEFDLVEPQRFLKDAELVVVIGRSVGRLKESGDPLDCEWVHIFTFAGDKVVRFKEYYDFEVMAKVRLPQM